jgi:hypothetical protein
MIHETLSDRKKTRHNYQLYTLGILHHCKAGSFAFTSVLWDTVKYYRTKDQKPTLKKKNYHESKTENSQQEGNKVGNVRIM